MNEESLLYTKRDEGGAGRNGLPIQTATTGEFASCTSPHQVGKRQSR